jgi:hypothetical protein
LDNVCTPFPPVRIFELSYAVWTSQVERSADIDSCANVRHQLIHMCVAKFVKRSLNQCKTTGAQRE